MKRILATLVLLTVLVSSAFATPSVMTDPKIRFWNQAGTAPLTGGKVYTYDAGTSTPRATYTDSTGLIQNTNPVVLDSRGEANIWLDGCYKVILKTSTGVTQWTVDNICSVSDFIDAVLSAQNEWQVQTDTPTYVSANSFSVSGDKRTSYQVGRRIKVETSGGTRYGWISASTYSAPNTTITVFVDTGNFTGISEVSLGILSVTNPSISTMPTVTKTTGETLTGSEVGRNIILNFTSAGTVTLPAMTTVPPGTAFNLYSIGTASALISGTVGTTVNPVLYQYDIARIVSDGVNTAWQGSIESETPAAGRIVRAKSTGKIDITWLPSDTTLYSVTTYTTSGTYTAPTVTGEIWVFAKGGGGGGGGGQSTADASAGGGGGEGAATSWRRYYVTSSAVYTVTVGTGGTGGAATAAGNSGGTTSIIKTDGTNTLSLTGGSGGAAGAGGTGGAVGANGTVSDSNAIWYGNWSASAPFLTAGTAGANGPAGSGGTGAGFGGATGGLTCNPGPCTGGAGNVATANTGSGGGGGGAGSTGGAGGNGSPGYLMILYFSFN